MRMRGERELKRWMSRFRKLTGGVRQSWYTHCCCSSSSSSCSHRVMPRWMHDVTSLPCVCFLLGSSPFGALASRYGSLLLVPVLADARHRHCLATASQLGKVRRIGLLGACSSCCAVLCCAVLFRACKHDESIQTCRAALMQCTCACACSCCVRTFSPETLSLWAHECFSRRWRTSQTTTTTPSRGMTWRTSQHHATWRVPRAPAASSMWWVGRREPTKVRVRTH